MASKPSGFDCSRQCRPIRRLSRKNISRYLVCICRRHSHHCRMPWFKSPEGKASKEAIIEISQLICATMMDSELNLLVSSLQFLFLFMSQSGNRSKNSRSHSTRRRSRAERACPVDGCRRSSSGYVCADQMLTRLSRSIRVIDHAEQS